MFMFSFITSPYWSVQTLYRVCVVRQYFSPMDPPVLTTLKIIIIGESGVGKTSLVLQFVNGSFDPDAKMTVGVDFKSTTVNIDGDCVKLAIWDTAGEERFRSVTPFFYRNTQGAIVVYDITNKKSFSKLKTWLQELEINSSKHNLIKMIVGNKIDKENREVSKEEGMELARRHAALFIESSAKTKDGVQCAFEELVQKIIQTPGLWKTDSSQTGGISLSEGQSAGQSPMCAGWTCAVN